MRPCSPPLILSDFFEHIFTDALFNPSFFTNFNRESFTVACNTYRAFNVLYVNSLTVTAPVRICKSDALNALFNHYRQQAIENNVDINWRIDLPDKSRILDVDLCSIFGNILENAIDGCCTVEEGKRYFNLTSEIKGDCLYIVSTNNYGKPLEMDGETYSSTKHQGKGIGLHSMKSITEVYDGIFDAGNNSGEFFVDIMLKY
jgi:two-component system, LytTR family, sensor histidine kinase AgrC